MKKIIGVITLMVLVFFSCEEQQQIVTIEENDLGAYPDEFTLDNWEEFIGAPKEVTDRILNQLESDRAILREEFNGESSNSFVDVIPNPRLLLGSVEVIELDGITRSFLGNTLVFNGVDSTRTSFIPFQGSDNFQIPPSSGAFCYFHKGRTSGNFTTAEWQSGVNVIDLVRMVNHINGTTEFDQLWQFLAADVDGNGRVELSDAFLLRDLIAGSVTELPLAQGLPQIEKIFQLSQPVFYVETTDYFKAQEELSNFLPFIRTLYAKFTCNPTGSIDRIAIKRGDLDRSWNLVD